jgi:hypothetical protein
MIGCEFNSPPGWVEEGKSVTLSSRMKLAISKNIGLSPFDLIPVFGQTMVEAYQSVISLMRHWRFANGVSSASLGEAKFRGELAQTA